MSVYQIHKFLYALDVDDELLALARTDLDLVLDRYKLTSEERSAIRAGDVARLYRMGVHGFLLNAMPRAGVVLDRETYQRRIKEAEPA